MKSAGLSFLKAVRWRSPIHRSMNRLILVMGIVLLYGVLYIPLYYFWGQGISLLSVIPVGFAGWFFGPLIGLVTSLLITVFNGWLWNMVGVLNFHWQSLAWMVVNFGACGMTGYLAGRWNDFRYMGQSHLVSGKDTSLGQKNWLISLPGDFEASMSSIVETIPEATLVVNRQGIIIFWNKASEELTGTEAKLVLGEHYSRVGGSILKEKRPLPVEYVLDPSSEPEKDYPGVKRDKFSFLIESYFPNFRPGGAYLNFRANPLLNLDGILVGAILMIQDVTEKNLALERQNIRDQRETISGLSSLSYFEKEISRIEYKKIFPNSILLIRLAEKPGSGIKGRGKNIGEASVKQFIVVLTAFFRANDLVAYLGERDFAVLIPKADTGVAQSLAERLRKSLGTQNLSFLESPNHFDVVAVTSLEVGTLSEVFQQGRQALGSN
jgi:PAS domain-containing protein/GGDEF domain-containing protein